MVMHELQTEVQSECMTSTLERSKSKNGSLIPFVSALVLKSACPEYCAHHRISPDVLTRIENGCNVADMKHLFQWAMRLEAQLLLFKGLWMEYGISMNFHVTHISVFVRGCQHQAVRGCTQHHRVLTTPAPNNLSNTCVILCRYLTAYKMTSVTWGI